MLHTFISQFGPYQSNHISHSVYEVYWLYLKSETLKNNYYKVLFFKVRGLCLSLDNDL